MKRLPAFCLAVLVVLLFTGPSTLQAQKKMAKGEHVMMAAEDLKWDTLKGAPAGVLVAVAYGNPETGPFGMFVKLPAGFTGPKHYHTSALRSVVVKGAYIYVPEKGAEKSFGAGSYFSYPAKDRHTTKGAADSETIFFVEGQGKFDIIPIEEKK